MNKMMTATVNKQNEGDDDYEQKEGCDFDSNQYESEEGDSIQENTGGVIGS